MEIDQPIYQGLLVCRKRIDIELFQAVEGIEC